MAGFSLIEAMIAVAIIGILTAIAYPSYVDYVVQGHRQKAMADLMALATAMEAHKAQQYTYEGAASSGGDTGAPAIFNSWSPADQPAANKQYDLTIHAINDNGRNFELRATPTTTAVVKSDGKLMFNSLGQKAWDSNNDSSFASSEYCWDC
ncbi:prepilin-type N-terminal cleavage/methylation domain-containing protein [Neiella marina]|uniref:Prepilin-type N-terminal cleavage/methylation domain-containing protein n=2 Tax=Neiella holothuriorum TaxID=2870530 RepID=A0ABS7EI39_9GAMM|nr:prepilin-type N-terminal cleavage/methylation domain-containing protein [Neiella holothuriorum]